MNDASPWPTYALTDVFEIRSGLSKSASEFGSGYPFVTFKDVLDNCFLPETLGSLVRSSETERELCDVRRGDVFLTRTSETQEELGMSSVALRDYDSATFNGFTKRLRPRDRNQIVPEYAAYYFRSPRFRSLMSGYSSLSTRASLNNDMLSRLQIVLPDVRTQEEIGYTLRSLDDKIQQNRRTGRALEALARATFKAWFVDFEPVKVKAAGAAAFPGMPQEAFAAIPDGFAESPLGPVPEAWEVLPATAIAAVAIGKTPPRKEPQWFSTDPSNVPWISIADMGSCGVFIRQSSEYLTAKAVERFNIRRIPAGSVLYSFKLTVGRVAITDGETTSNEAIAHFIPSARDTLGSEYLYCYLLAFDHAQLGSTSSIATATNSKAVKAIPMLVPSADLAAAFTHTVRPLFEMIRALSRESSKLSAMRDYLLPRLLSGQVRKRQLEADVRP